MYLFTEFFPSGDLSPKLEGEPGKGWSLQTVHGGTYLESIVSVWIGQEVVVPFDQQLFSLKHGIVFISAVH